MIAVDAWCVYKGITKDECFGDEVGFYGLLADKMIENNMDRGMKGRGRIYIINDFSSPYLIRKCG